MKRSGHGRKGERGDQRPVSGMEVALVASDERFRGVMECTSLVLLGRWLERLDPGWHRRPTVTRESLQAIPATGLDLGPTCLRHARKPCTCRRTRCQR